MSWVCVRQGAVHEKFIESAGHKNIMCGFHNFFVPHYTFISFPCFFKIPSCICICMYRAFNPVSERKKEAERHKNGGDVHLLVYPPDILELDQSGARSLEHGLGLLCW